MDQPDPSTPMTSTQRRLKSLQALLLSLFLGTMGVILLLSILDTRTVVSASQREKAPGNLTRLTPRAATAPAADGVRITKTVEPPNPATGGMVSICFTISGLGPRRLDVVLAQDVSTSMNGPAGESTTQTRLEASQAAASAFVGFLPATDRTAVVSYSASARLAHPLTTTKSAVTSTIYGLTTIGGTNIGAGISVSHKELITSPRYLSDTIKTIILLSDGQANLPGSGSRPRQYALERAAAAARDNIRIYSIGFGSDADESLLQSIADTSGGKYFFAPDGDVLKTIYLTIALELHNVIITDVLAPGVETDCSLWPEGWCVEGPGGVTTLTLPISDSLLLSDPAVYCFTATVTWDPDDEGPTNLPGSGICYEDADGQTICQEFENPRVTVGGRKVTGDVYYDVNANGRPDPGEGGAPDVMVRTNTGVISRTNASGSFVLRTSNQPAISVTIAMPSGHLPTTPISHPIPSITGTYSNRDFGIYGGACMQGKVFDDVNANGRDDDEAGLAGAKITASDGTTTTTGPSGIFTVCAPVGTGPVTVTERDPTGYTSTVALNGVGVRIVDSNTLRVDNPDAGRMYAGNKFGDLRVIPRWSLYLPVFMRDYPLPSIINGGFEEGWTGWTHGGELPQTVLSTNPHMGSFSALLGDPAYECENGVPVGSAWVEQAFFVPHTISPTLSFWYNIFTQDRNPFLDDEFDSFDVRIDGNLVFRDAKKKGTYGCAPGVEQDLGWQSGEIDLSRYRGRRVVIRFENRSSPDGWFNTWTFVDDVQFTH